MKSKIDRNMLIVCLLIIELMLFGVFKVDAFWFFIVGVTAIIMIMNTTLKIKI